MVSRRKNKWLKTGGIVLLIAGIFVLGWMGGSGRLSFKRLPSQQTSTLPQNLDYSSVNEVYQLLKANYDGDLDTKKLTDGLKRGMVAAAGNTYTEYLSQKDYDAFNNELDGTFSGIGAELGQNTDNLPIVISPISGYPAEKAGLQSQDIIISVNGKTTAGQTLSQVVDSIRGPKGTEVTLTVVRSGEEDPITVKIIREEITVASVTSKVENGVGYIKISRFGEDTVELAQKAAKEFKDQNVKGVVLDLRGDPGGLLDAAVGVSSLWLPQGKTILTERHKGQVTQTYVATGTNTLVGVPTAVLINGGSASASEITAGALHDAGVATLVGTKSYGKGSVQQILRLKNGGALKVTIARWYTPKGKNIDKSGITPDKVIERTSEQAKSQQDPQKDAAIAVVQK